MAVDQCSELANDPHSPALVSADMSCATWDGMVHRCFIAMRMSLSL